MVCLAVGIHDSMQFMHVYFVLSNSFDKILRNHREMQACTDKHLSLFEL